MNNEEYLLDWYSNHIWSRPKPSKVCDGVGSFAIRDIPKGTSVYELASKTVSTWIPWSKVSTLPDGVVGCIYDIQPQMGTITNSTGFGWEHAYGPLWVYTTKGLNWQTNWFFQNHSDNPNVNTFPTDNPRIFKFIADRDIKEGEELFENYDDYSYKWEKISQNGKSG